MCAMANLKAAVATALIGLASCSGDRTEIDARVQHWKSVLQTVAPVGATRSDLEAWSKANGFNFHYLPQQQELYANVEQVPVRGLKFPCSQWNIIAEIKLDVDGHATGNKVSAVGTCI